MAAPTTPTITASATGITVDGDAGVTNYVYYRKVGVAPGSWAQLGSRSGDGIVLFGSLAAGKYQWVAVSKSTEYSLPSDPVDYYVGGSTSSIHELVALDAAADLEAEAALGAGRLWYIDRRENRMEAIVRGDVGSPMGTQGYMCFEWSRVEEEAGPEDYEEGRAQLQLHMLYQERPGESGAFPLARAIDLAVQALESDRSRGGLVWRWRYAGCETNGPTTPPWRAAILKFSYDYGCEPGARISTS